jgi:hypothetical protein
MTKEELIKKLSVINETMDKEIGHGLADDLLLEYINDEEISKAFNDVEKWYA